MGGGITNDDRGQSVPMMKTRLTPKNLWEFKHFG